MLHQGHEEGLNMVVRYCLALLSVSKMLRIGIQLDLLSAPFVQSGDQS